MKFLNKETLLEIFKFGVTGGLSFIVDFGTMYLLKEFCGIDSVVASAIGFSVSVIFNYILCILWVFDVSEEKKKDKKTVIIFIGTSLIGLLINTGIMWIFNKKIMIDYRIAKIIATLVVMIWNYITKKKAVS